MNVPLDSKQLAELVGQQNGVRIDAGDPIVLAAAIVERVVGEGHKKTLAEVERLVTGLADQVSTTIVLAENTAKARAESIVTEAAKWSSDQIRTAAADATAMAIAELKDAVEEARVTRAETKLWARISIGAASVAGIAAMVIIGWQVWG